MRLKINRSAAFAAACAAGLSSSMSYAQTWTSWGDLGAGDISMANTSATTRSPRQFGLVVANGNVYGAYDQGFAGTSTTGGFAAVFKLDKPVSQSGTLSIQNVVPGNDGTGMYSGIDKMIYNPKDGQIYLRSNAITDWETTTLGQSILLNNTTTTTTYKSGVLKMNPSNLATTKIFSPSNNDGDAFLTDITPTPPTNTKNVWGDVSGMTLDYDTGNIIFSTNNRPSGFQQYNLFYYNPTANTVTNLRTTTGQNAQQRGDNVVYLGNGKIAELDSGTSANRLNVFNYDASNTSTFQQVPAGNMAYNLSGNFVGNSEIGGVTAALWDQQHQSLHVLGRERVTSGQRLINTDWFPAAGESSFVQNYASPNISQNVWHASIPGSNLANTAAASGSNAVAVNSSVLTPDGNMLIAFAGQSPYGVAGAQSHMWLKTVSPNGSSRVASNDTNNWVDMGIIDTDPNVSSQVVSVTTGNIGAGSLGAGKDSYDIWAITQDRVLGNLRLFSTASEFKQRLSWDLNGTTAGAGTAPTGNWDGATANFNTDLLGGSAGSFTAATGGTSVVAFSAGFDSTGTYTVTISNGAKTASRLEVERGNVTIAAATAGDTVSAGSYEVFGGAVANVSAPIVGAVTKGQGGTMRVSGPQNYAGVTTVNAGTLTFAAPQSLYAGNSSDWNTTKLVVKSGATLGVNVGGGSEFTVADVTTLATLGNGTGGFLNNSSLGLDTTNAAGGTFTYAGTFADHGADKFGINKLGSGELVLSGTSTHTGGTTASGGTLTAVNTGSLGAATNPLIVNSTTGTSSATTVNLSSAGGTTVGSLSGSVTGAGNTANINNNGQLFTVNQAANGTYEGTISGAGGLTKTGAATLALSGASTYSGVTTISAGTLSINAMADNGVASPISAGGASPSAADLVLNGGTLQYTGGGHSSNRQFTVTNAAGSTLAASGSGALNLTNTGPVVFSNAGANTLNLGGTNTNTNTLAALVANNGGATGVTKSGGGVWKLSNNANSYTGSTNITGGTLVVDTIGAVGVNSAIGAGSGAANDIVLNNGGIQFTGSSAATTNRQITAGPGVISPAGATGAGVLPAYPANVGANNNANLGNGATSTIDASGGAGATLTFSASSALNGTGGSITGFRKLNLTGTNTGDNTIGFNITDGGAGSGSIVAVDKNGAGTWVLSGTNTYMGRTTVNAGTLKLQGAKPVGNWAQMGANDASGGGFSNQIYVNNSGSRVELSTTAATHLEQMGLASGTFLVLGGQRLNIYTGASGNGGTNTLSGIISGSGGIAVGPQINLGTPFYSNGIPQTGLNRTLTFAADSTYTGGTYVQGGNVAVTNVKGLGADFQKLEVSNLRFSGNTANTPGLPFITGAVVNFSIGGLNTPSSPPLSPEGTNEARLNVLNLSGDIVAPDNAGAGGINTMTINLGTGGQRVLNVLQTADTTYYGSFSGQNGNAGGGEFRLDPASTGTLTLIGATASSGNATVQAATNSAGGSTNGGRVRVMGGTLLLKTPGALSNSNLPASGPLTREPTGSNTTLTGGTGVYATVGGTVAVNVGGPAPAAVAGKPVVGAEWTSADVDRLKNVGRFEPGSMLGFDTTNAPGGTFTYASALGGFNINNGVNGAPVAYDNTGMGVAKLGTGTLTLSGNSTITGPTQVRAGTLIAAHANALPTGALTVANGATGQLQAGLSTAVKVASIATTGSGKFDITNNSMVIRGSTDAAVRAELIKGYNAGAWNGPGGIGSTSITAETSIGYATKLQTGITDFKGVTGMADTDVQVKYTYAGDANLDGKVDIGDLGLLAGAWQAASGKVWFDGDFTYDGAVDIGDLGLLSGNWQKGTAGNPNPPLMDFATAMAQFSAFDGVVVPEPASLGLLGVAGIGLLARRRRRS